MSRLNWALSAVAGLALLAALALLLGTRPEPPARGEDGVFAHDCCGTIKLEKGRIVVGEQSIRYALDRDGQGPFILPATYVGPYEDRGFEVDGSRPPLKLRPDALPRPDSIDMEAYGKVFRFERERARVHQPGVLETTDAGDDRKR